MEYMGCYAPARIPIIAGVPSPPEEELDELSAADELELAAYSPDKFIALHVIRVFL